MSTQINIKQTRLTMSRCQIKHRHMTMQSAVTSAKHTQLTPHLHLVAELT